MSAIKNQTTRGRTGKLDKEITHLIISRCFLIGLMVVSILALLVCTPNIGHTKNFGHMMNSSDVELKFKEYQVDENLNYYIYGSQIKPTAIIGLNKEYTLESKLWHEIDFNEISLQALVDRVRGRRGAFILDPEDNRIGVWFGDGTATIKMAGEKRIAFISPSSR